MKKQVLALQMASVSSGEDKERWISKANLIGNAISALLIADIS